MSKSLSEKVAALFDAEKKLPSIIDALTVAKEKTAERIKAEQEALKEQVKTFEEQSQALDETLQNL